MLQDEVSAERYQFDAIVRGIAVPRDRTPEPRGGLVLPPGTVVVSADNHWSVTGDIFYDNFPPHLKDRAPRLFTDETGFHHWDVNGQSVLPPTVRKNFALFESVPGCVSIEPRLRDLDSEGIEKEIIFGNGINVFLVHPDIEVREWVCRIYNEYLAEMAAKAPGRFYGVGGINFWDMAKVRQSIADIKALGLKTFLLPQFPKGANGASLNYCAPEMAPLWEGIEEAGLPVCFHVGEVFTDGPGGVGTTAMTSFAPFRKTFGELVFGGIFDRHPGLQVMFAEGDINWVPGALQTATMTYECLAPLLQPRIKHHPRYYWHRHCYVTFMYDPVGLTMLDIVGPDRVMWSSDYPHPESTFGYGWSAMRAVLDAVPADQARMILGGTATKVFALDCS
jgi:predicted TIM-barrel fold metal-dependent hydrolase